MARVTAGGDPERYMDPPSVSSGDGESGGGSFFGSLLDFLGVGKVVGKIADKASGGEDTAKAQAAANVTPAGTTDAAAPAPKEQAPATTQPANEGNGLNKLLSDFDLAFGNNTRPADQNNFLTPIDPDIAALLPRTSL